MEFDVGKLSKDYWYDDIADAWNGTIAALPVFSKTIVGRGVSGTALSFRGGVHAHHCRCGHFGCKAIVIDEGFFLACTGVLLMCNNVARYEMSVLKACVAKVFVLTSDENLPVQGDVELRAPFAKEFYVHNRAVALSHWESLVERWNCTCGKGSKCKGKYEQ